MPDEKKSDSKPFELSIPSDESRARIMQAHHQGVVDRASQYLNRPVEDAIHDQEKLVDLARATLARSMASDDRAESLKAVELLPRYIDPELAKTSGAKSKARVRRVVPKDSGMFGSQEEGSSDERGEESKAG